MGRYTKSLFALSKDIPEEVLVGVHLCYGDFRHKQYCRTEGPELLRRIGECDDQTRRTPH